MDGRIYRRSADGIVCQICGETGGLHMAHCEVLTLIRTLEAIAGNLGAYVADMRDTIAEAEKILR